MEPGGSTSVQGAGSKSSCEPGALGPFFETARHFGTLTHPVIFFRSPLRAQTTSAARRFAPFFARRCGKSQWRTRSHRGADYHPAPRSAHAARFPTEPLPVNVTPLLALHEAAGARMLPGGTPTPLLTYGDVPGEYRAAREGAALFDECDRGMLRVDGDDAPEFLHRLLANTVLDLTPGRGVRNMLLTPQGKVRFLFELQRTDAGFLISTAPGDAPRLREALDMFLFAEAIELEDISDSHAPVCLLGPNSDELLAGLLGSSLPEEVQATITAELAGVAVRVTRTTRFGSPAWRIDAGPSGVEAAWNAIVGAGAQPAGRVVADSLRAEACTAEAGVDIDDTVYPQEARLEPAFSLDKGCYIGQEVVAKIDTYGGLNKRMVCLRVSHDDPVAPGTQLERFDEKKDEWRALGVATSWAYSFELDGGIVLAYVKRRHQAPGTEFRLMDGSGTATIVASPIRPDAVPVTGEFE